MGSSVNANEAKVYKAHAAPLEICDNLINSLKLLAHGQKDGDSPTQSIVTGLHERGRRGIMNGLRRFIQADNHNAVDVGDLRQGTTSLKVGKPKFSEAFPEATIWEGADDLTLRADEVGTLRALSTQSTLNLRGVDRTGMLSSKQSTKELKGKSGESCSVTSEI